MSLDTEKSTVLVAEDEACLLYMTQVVLKQEGYTVLSASDAEEALYIAETYTGNIDLLLTDMRLPTMDGANLSIKFRETHPESKVVYMSAYPKVELQERLPDETILSKPFCVGTLCDTISMSLQCE